METDSAFARDAIRTSVNTSHPHANLVARIKSLLHDDYWDCSVNHVFSEANSDADHLAKLGHSLPLECHEFPHVVDSCRDSFEADRYGTAYPRLVTRFT